MGGDPIIKICGAAAAGATLASDCLTKSEIRLLIAVPGTVAGAIALLFIFYLRRKIASQPVGKDHALLPDRGNESGNDVKEGDEGENDMKDGMISGMIMFPAGQERFPMWGFRSSTSSPRK